MSVFGIDVGYLSATVAAPKGGGIEVLLNEYSQRQTASNVSFGEKQRELGEGARQKAITNFKNTIGLFKHFVGRDFDDEEVQSRLKLLHYKDVAVAMPDGGVGFNVKYLGKSETYSATQVLAMLLTRLKTISANALGAKVLDCVVGVPCYFNDRQRHAFLAATKIAGLNCLSLLNETTAVALAYGIYRSPQLPTEDEKARRVVFVDVGHSQIQMSMCDMVKGQLTVLATASDTVGGRDLDMILHKHFAAEFKEKYKIDVSTNPRAAIRLENECEKVKKLMASNEKGNVPLNIECLMDDKDVSSSMKSDTFQEMAQEVIDRFVATGKKLISTMEAASKDSKTKFSLDDIDFVETVGGAVRIPFIRRIIQDLFGKELSTTLNFDEAVSRGCALWAAIKSPTLRVREFSVHDKTNYAVTLNWAASGDEDETPNAQVFTPNSATHISKLLTFYRDSDFDLTATYTEPENVIGKASDIGTFRIGGVTPSCDGGSNKIKAKIRLDEHGCFSISEAHMIEKIAAVEEASPEDKKEDKKEDEKKEDDKKDGETKDGDKNDGDKKEEKKEDSKADKPAEASPAKKKAKTSKTTQLTVTPTLHKVLTQAEIQALIEVELDMQSKDREEKEKSDAKNSLEEYIYAIRDKVQGECSEFIKEADSEAFCKKLTEFEDWLYDEGEDETKSVYGDKLAELKGVGEPVVARSTEASKRPEVIAAFQQSLVLCRKFLDQKAAGDEKYAHIADEDVKKVQDIFDLKEKWLNETTAKLNAQPKFEDPCATVNQFTQEHSSFDNVYVPIMNKPVPKADPPPPAETPKETETPKEAPKEGEAEAATDAPKEGEKMEVDPPADSATMEVD
eukprot:m.215273 g.215273  ORF g.215273 m.215273 type:complete len:848 (+) comp19089_c0_seq2:55-2598(+)